MRVIVGLGGSVPVGRVVTVGNGIGVKVEVGGMAAGGGVDVAVAVGAGVVAAGVATT